MPDGGFYESGVLCTLGISLAPAFVADRNGTARLHTISSRENGTYSVQPLYIPEIFV